jgi:hypothetical protein
MHPPHFSRALSMLLQAHCYSKELRCDRWDFAIELVALQQAGLTNSDLRWLLRKGYILQAVEIVPPPDGSQRAFVPLDTLVLDERSCFVLTAEGIASAAPVDGLPSAGEAQLPARKKEGPCQPPPELGEPVPASLPVWDKQRRALIFREQIIKQFKLPAPNQELILAVFEEEGWAPHIDDPLPLAELVDPKRRLHDTINALNRHQRAPLLRFLGDGLGQGVFWKACSLQHTHQGPPVGLPADKG